VHRREEKGKEKGRGGEGREGDREGKEREMYHTFFINLISQTPFTLIYL
jgi:hypothetical protein